MTVTSIAPHRTTSSAPQAAPTAVPTTAPTALSVDALAAIVRDIADHPDDWRDRVEFHSDERWWVRLHTGQLVDVWLLTWVQDTGTDLHDHGDSAGAFTIVSGSLEEVRPGPNGELAVTQLRAGHTQRVARGVVHDVRSPSDTPALSIHAYSPPLRSMTFYEQGSHGPAPTRTVTTETDGDLL